MAYIVDGLAYEQLAGEPQIPITRIKVRVLGLAQKFVYVRRAA